MSEDRRFLFMVEDKRSGRKVSFFSDDEFCQDFHIHIKGQKESNVNLRLRTDDCSHCKNAEFNEEECIVMCNLPDGEEECPYAQNMIGVDGIWVGTSGELGGVL